MFKYLTWNMYLVSDNPVPSRRTIMRICHAYVDKNYLQSQQWLMQYMLIMYVIVYFLVCAITLYIILPYKTLLTYISSQPLFHNPVYIDTHVAIEQSFRQGAKLMFKLFIWASVSEQVWIFCLANTLLSNLCILENSVIIVLSR